MVGVGNETALTAEQILAATEDVLRRFGPSKANVIDVARALDVSHGSVYRHFPSKAALREAVVRRWLDRATAGLSGIAAEDGPAADRLRRWMFELHFVKRRKTLDDPEMFETYAVLAEAVIKRAPDDQISAHLVELHQQVVAIIADGIARGEFADTDVRMAAKAAFDATVVFHDPRYHFRWDEPDIEDTMNYVCDLIIAGLSQR